MSSTLSLADEGPSPPPAPPLPPQPHTVTSRARSALARFTQPLINSSRLQNVNQARPPGLGIRPSSSPVFSKTAVHRTGIPIAALDISPSKTHAIVAGREILKTIRVTDSKCFEEDNLRAAVIAYSATHKTAKGVIAAKHKDQLAANDVKWSHGAFDTHVATAAPNGQIVLYDIQRAGVELARLHEHTRQVHRLGFNPHQGAWMLSGSRDATIKLWDIRTLTGERSVLTSSSKETFAGHSDGVRDLRWSPTDGFEFAAGTDNGVIQRWDLRKPTVPLLKIAAHDMTCNSIDWHPSGKHLVSGGADKNVKVWDFASPDRRMKPAWHLRAPQAVLNVRWRPAFWSLDGNRLGKWHCTHVATSYGREDPKVHVWDFRRPSVPLRVLDRYDTPPAAFLWHSKDLLWSVGSAGIFTQTDIEFTPKVMDHRSPNLVNFAADGQILFCSMRRDRRRLPMKQLDDIVLKDDRRQCDVAEKASSSHSATDGSLEEPGALYSSLKHRRSKNLGSVGSNALLTGTSSSSATDVIRPLVPLEKALQVKYTFKPPQVIASGYVAGLFDAKNFKFFARHLRTPPQAPPGTSYCDLHSVFAEVIQHNARVASYAGQHRLSQTWEVLGLMVKEELEQRAGYNRKARVALTDTQTLVNQEGPRIASSARHPLEARHEDPAVKIASSSKEIDDRVPTGTDVSSGLKTSLAKSIEDCCGEPWSVLAFDTTGNAKMSELSWTKQPLKPLLGSSELRKMAEANRQGSGTSKTQGHDGDGSEKITSLECQSSGSVVTDSRNSGKMDRNIPDPRAVAGGYGATTRSDLKFEKSQVTALGHKAAPIAHQNSSESLHMFSAPKDQSSHPKSALKSPAISQESVKSTRTHLGQVTNTDEDRRGVYNLINEEDRLLADKQSANTVSSKKLFETSEGTSNIHNENVESSSGLVQSKKSERHKDCGYLKSDFLPPSSKDDDLPPLPWTATALLLPLAEYHATKLADSHLPTWIIIHLLPYFEVQMPRSRALAIVLHHHKKLTTFQLYTQAAELRLLAMDQYPELSAYGHGGVDSGGSYCTHCSHGASKSRNEMSSKCDVCRNVWGECSICEGYGPLSSEHLVNPETVAASKKLRAGDKLWGWCSACGHGGHMGCLRVWWNESSSEGGCPTRGCLCDCMPGSRRDEIYRKIEIDRKSTTGPVNRDDRGTQESGAAQRTRGLTGSIEAMKGAGRSILQAGDDSRGPSGLGSIGRSTSGGKKVRIVVPSDNEEAIGGEEMDVETSASAP